MTALRRLGTALLSLIGVVLLVALAYLAWVTIAVKTGTPQTAGAVQLPGLNGRVTVARDARGIPHIRASTTHDAFFAEGYAMATDRLFQMDLVRRYVYGRLAELIGPPVAETDRFMRRYDIASVARGAFAAASPDEQAFMRAFADGVNAAAEREATPPEYRALFARFEPWKPEDALAVGMSTVLDLDDRAIDVITRDRVHALLGNAGTDAFYPLTDPAYDVPTDGSSPGPLPSLPPLSGAKPIPDGRTALLGEERAIGSNMWAVGADRVVEGHAVLANDPHLDMGVPGVWWLVDLSAPGYHVAGAALVGTPGVTLGHNDHVAWGVTSGYGAAFRVLKEPIEDDRVRERGTWVTAKHRDEKIGVRFGAPVTQTYLETPRGTVVASDKGTATLMVWPMKLHPTSPLDAFSALSRAGDVDAATRALALITEPPLNVMMADDRGRVAYHYAGMIPADDSWSRWAVTGDTPDPATLAFDTLPKTRPARDAFLVTANNRPNGGALRLGPFFPAPYRAYEIRRALDAVRRPDGKWTLFALTDELRDDASPAELEFAKRVLELATANGPNTDAAIAPLLDALANYDGKMTSDSKSATVVAALRRESLRRLVRYHLPADLVTQTIRTGPSFGITLRVLRERPAGWVPNNDYRAWIVDSLHAVARTLGPTIPPFSTYAALPLKHPLAPFGFGAWNGPTLPGRGGSYAPAVQWDGHAQSFRAVWVAGDWDRSTIDIPAGESGRPGNPHYTDLTPAWARFEPTTFPYSDAAVQAATKETLILRK